MSSPEGVLFCPKDGTALSPDSSSGHSLIGSMVERYRLIGRLGEGGMGTVYRAEHTHLNRQVALKLLHPEMARSTAVLDRFFREARAASAVKSPHIIEVTDFGTTPDGRSFLVMELLDGMSLRELLDSSPGRRLPPARGVAIALQIADALAVAHERGVIHRDLKPANVLLVERDGDPDFVKIVDFGVAKLTDPAGAQLTQTGMIMGSPTYMAPEQAAGKPVDGRADLYSLGVILYEMLVGSPPFTGDGTTSILMAQMSVPPEPPRARNPDVPEPLEALVLHCLAKRAEDRPRDLVAVKRALQSWQTGQTLDTFAMETSDASSAPATRPAALTEAGASLAVPSEAESAPDASITSTGSRRGEQPSTPIDSEPRQPRRRRRTGIVLVAAVLGLLAGVGLTLHLLGTPPEALLGPIAARWRGSDQGSSSRHDLADGAGSVVEDSRDAAPVAAPAPPDAGPRDSAPAVRDIGPAGAAGRAPDAAADDDDLDDDDEQASPDAGTTPVPVPGKPGKVSKKKSVVMAAKKVQQRLTPKQAARRQALKAKLKAEHAHLKRLLHAHRISQAHYRRAVASLKQRYRALK